MKFLLVDECTITRDGLKLALQLMGNTEIIGETDSVTEALHLAAETSPNFAIVDPELGDTQRHYLQNKSLNAGFCRELKAASGSLHLVAYTFHDTPAGVASMMLAGVDSYVYKGLKSEQLEEAKSRFSKGEQVLMFGPRTRDVGVVMRVSSYMNRLTAREREVLDLLFRGYKRDEAAEALHISIYTCRNHTRNILRKCEVKSLKQLYNKLLG
ncbi:MAG: response regulator transcription factor [Rubrobacteraceae bacterium]